VGIKFDPQIEGDQEQANGPADESDTKALASRLTGAYDGEQAVREEVAHEDEINEATETEPGIVLNRSLAHLVVLGDLGFEFMLEQVVEPWSRVLPGLRVLEQLPPLCPGHQEFVLRLDGQEIANTNIIRGSPKQEESSEDRPLEAPWQRIRKPAVKDKSCQHNDIREILGFARIEKLRDHVMGLGDDEDCMCMEVTRSADWAIAFLAPELILPQM